jgi:hypothetical protein
MLKTDVKLYLIKNKLSLQLIKKQQDNALLFS